MDNNEITSARRLRFYSCRQVTDAKSACEWLVRLRTTPNFTPVCFELSEIMEDGQFAEFRLPTSVGAEDLLNAAKKHAAQSASIIGKYDGQFITIGVNLQLIFISITTANDYTDVPDELVSQLQLFHLVMV